MRPCVRLGLVVLALAGCGDPDGRLRFEGTVTYGGEPVPSGTLMFDPDTSRGGHGVQGSAEIVNGRYKTVPGFGPATGPHVARVTGYRTLVPDYNNAPWFQEVRVEVDLPDRSGQVDVAVPAPKPKSATRKP